MSQYGNKALSLAAVPSTLMLLPYLESLRNMQPGLHNFPMGQQSAVSSPPFAGLHPALTQLSPTFLGSSTPTSSASSNATKTSPPVTSMVTSTKNQIISSLSIFKNVTIAGVELGCADDGKSAIATQEERDSRAASTKEPRRFIRIRCGWRNSLHCFPHRQETPNRRGRWAT
jgi:hypothetical protein